MPDYDANFMVETDASDVEFGTMLIQHDQPSYLHVKSAQLCTM